MGVAEMREPTPISEQYAWHLAALAGVGPEITATPQAGWFKRRLVRGGPWVPCRLWWFQEIDDAGDLLDDERLQAECNGEYADPDDIWSFVASNPITEAEFKFLSATVEWSRVNAPDEPMANPRQAVDWCRVPTPTF
jgi:hypothetical protein